VTAEAWFREVLNAHADFESARRVQHLAFEAVCETEFNEGSGDMITARMRAVERASMRLVDEARERLNAALLKASEGGEVKPDPQERITMSCTQQLRTFDMWKLLADCVLPVGHSGEHVDAKGETFGQVVARLEGTEAK
jgi:hypothetical protein